jgi:hypothetical protein
VASVAPAPASLALAGSSSSAAVGIAGAAEEAATADATSRGWTVPCSDGAVAVFAHIDLPADSSTGTAVEEADSASAVQCVKVAGRRWDDHTDHGSVAT